MKTMARSENARGALLVGLTATLFYTAFSWVPSFWFDEAATVSAVRRTPAELLDLLGNIDIVHGAYYFMMQGWTALFGVSEFAVRVPSALAGGVATGLVFAIGSRLGTRRYALIAAGLFMVLPRVQYAAMEARPFIFALALGAVATWALVRIWQAKGEPTARWWVLYAFSGTLGVLFSFYLVLLFAAHAVAVLSTRELRRRWLPFFACGALWALPAIAVGLVGYAQRAQVAWIRPLGPATAIEYVVAQFSSRLQFLDGLSPTPALGKIELAATVVVSLLLFLTALIGTWRARRHFLVRLALPWLLVPIAALAAGSLILGSTFYLPRYLTFTAPAIALLSAAALTPLRSTAPATRPLTHIAAVVTAGALLLAAVPATISLRTTGGKDASYDYQWVAKTVAQNAQPGDAIAPMGGEPNLIVRSYPDSFTGLADPTLVEPAGSIDLLFDGRVGIASAADKVQQYDRVWLIREKNDGVSPADLAALGYIPNTEYKGVTRVVTLYVRG